jgi:fatty acid desaturase
VKKELKEPETPKNFIVRLLEGAAMFALACFLLKLGIALIQQIWWILLIIAVVVGGGVIAYRLWKNRGTW